MTVKYKNKHNTRQRQQVTATYNGRHTVQYASGWSGGTWIFTPTLQKTKWMGPWVF